MESKGNLTFEPYKEEINIWYKSNNIIREKADLYYDFLISLLGLINETYLGSDIIQSEEDIANHITWCFNRVISNFEYERIYFTTNLDNYEYLWYFFYKGYYKTDDDRKYSSLLAYFDLLFNYNKVKTASELESFIVFYKILDQNLKKIN
jgi:hypothetical protein